MPDFPAIQRREPAALVARFRRVDTITLPVKSSPAGLGEVLVHAEDIRRPLGLRHVPDAEGLLAVARFFATKDFAVNSKTLVKDLTLRAIDASFQEGAGSRSWPTSPVPGSMS